MLVDTVQPLSLGGDRQVVRADFLPGFGPPDPLAGLAGRDAQPALEADRPGLAARISTYS